MAVSNDENNNNNKIQIIEMINYVSIRITYINFIKLCLTKLLDKKGFK